MKHRPAADEQWWIAARLLIFYRPPVRHSFSGVRFRAIGWSVSGGTFGLIDDEIPGNELARNEKEGERTANGVGRA